MNLKSADDNKNKNITLHAKDFFISESVVQILFVNGAVPDGTDIQVQSDHSLLR